MFRLVANAQEAKGGAPLAPILGQQQIKVIDFVNEFNKRSTMFVSGIPLNCRIQKQSQNKFTLTICPPTFGLLLYSAAVNNKISQQDLFFIMCYRFVNPEPSHFKCLLGTLKSLKYQVL